MKTIKIIIALFLLTTLVGCSKDVQEEEKYEMLEYEYVNDLISKLESDDEFVGFEVMNDIIYTINEDNLEDSFYDILYYGSVEEQKSISFEYGWLAYLLATKDYYCDEKESEYRTCKIGDGSFYNLTYSVPWYKHLAPVIISDKDNDYFYSTAMSDNIIEAVDYAYIISQGEGTPGYEEAMNWSYEVAVSNGYSSDENTFRKNYSDNISEYESDLQKMQRTYLQELQEVQGKDIHKIQKKQLQEMEKTDLEWMVDNYDDYSEVLREINRNLKIID